MSDEPGAPTRLSTRDLLGPTALFFAMLLIAAAFAMRPMVAAQQRLIPLDIDQTWVLDSSTPPELLDRCSLDDNRARVVSGELQQRRRVVAVRPAGDDIVTLQASTALGVDHYLIDGKEVDPEDACAEPTLQATVDRVTVDRTTALPAGRASEIQYAADKGFVQVPDRRASTYRFAYGLHPAPTEYFDPVSRQTVPLTRSGEETVDGRTAIRFVAQIPDTDLGLLYGNPELVLTRPASWFGGFPGIPGNKELTATLHHRAEHQLLVDAATGVILDEWSALTQEYRFVPADIGAAAPNSRSALTAYALPNLRAELRGDPATARDAAAAAQSQQRRVTLTGTALPITFGVTGALLLIAGVILIVRRPRATPPSPAPTPPQPPSR